MNKKKFLTIALVSVILVIVGLLTYNLFVKNRLEFNKNEELFTLGVKNYLEHNENKLPLVNNYLEVSLKDMYKSKWVDTLKVKSWMCDENSFVRVINDNGSYRYITYLKCGKYSSKIDNVEPEIVLNGSDTVIVKLNSTYQDAGVKEVKDNKDKLSVSDVVVDTSGVNTSKTGTYEVTYKVYDKTYNLASITRKVIVADTLSNNIARRYGENYTYTGDVEDNYVLFSGMMFRIVNTDSEGNIKLITDSTISNVSYGDGDYKDSNVYTWLNEYFYNNISDNSKKYMKEVTWCYDNQENPCVIEACDSSVKGYVGLLSLSEYQKSFLDNSSYLVRFSRFSLLNRKSYNKIWITDTYEDNRLYAMNNNDLIGIRPVIVLDKDIYMTGGNGTLSNPYKLQDYYYALENDSLNTRLIGEYVRYSGYDFRISDIDNDGNIKLTLAQLFINSNNTFTVGYDEDVDVVPSVSTKGNLYYKLNNDVINYIKDDLIVEHKFLIPVIDTSKKYNEVEKMEIKSKMSIPASYEMFSAVNSNFDNSLMYWLSDYSNDSSITIINGMNGVGFNLNRSNSEKNALKINIYLSKDTKISKGKGTLNSPYYVR